MVSSSSSFPLRQVGIYRNLPNFDPTITGLSAVICGASGISGFNTLRALLSSPARWETIYTLARSPLKEEALQLLTSEQRAHIKHVSVDLTADPSAIANTLQEAGVRAEYVFFYTYLPPANGKNDMDKDSAQALVDANVPLLRNFLSALPQASIQPRRILLQTGGKNYGMHIGRVRTPLVESDPQPWHLSPNFYYLQEELLFEYCKTHPETAWNVIRPAGVIGASPSVGMNTFYSFAIYAAVQARKGQPLKFGGDITSWQFEAAHSTATLTGFLSEWAVLEDHCANQAFNAQDSSPLSWDRFFQELARWYGVEKGVVGPELDDASYQNIPMAGGKDAPLGYGPPLVVRRSYALSDWAEEEENKLAWEQVMKDSKGQLKTNPWNGNIRETMMGDFAYLNFGTLSLNKVKRYGFSGFVDSLESIFEQYKDMERLGQLPKMKVDAAKPLV